MWIVRLALRRPYAFIVAALLLLLLTPFILLRTPAGIFPNINIPVVSVVGVYNGLNAKDVEDRVIYNHERMVSTLNNDIEHMESTAYNGAGVSELEASERFADHKLKAATADASRAEARRLQEVRSFSRITAPFSGTTTARGINSGGLIASGGAKELFHLAQTKRLRVFVQVPQAMARGIENEQTAEISLPEFPGQKFTAKVIRSAGAFTDASPTMQVELEVDNSQGKIMAGGYAQVRFPQLKLDAALTLPSNTVFFRAEAPQVGVVLPDGTVELRNVALGRNFGQSIEIASGVTPRDREIVNLSDSLAAGGKAAVTEMKKPGKAEPSEKAAAPGKAEKKEKSPEYRDAFAAIFPRQAAKHGATLYPLLGTGLLGKPELVQADGAHSNEKMARIIAGNLYPLVVELIAKPIQ